MTRVAVLDGHQMLRDVMPALLSGPELEVVIAVGSWAELIVHAAYPPQVVILDGGLDDGVPTVDKVRAIRADGCRVVVLGPVDDAAWARTYLAAGAHGLVGMVDDGQTVVGAVLAAMRGRQYLSPQVLARLRDGEDGVRLVPVLSSQEARTLSLYASGLPLKSVARVLGIGYETAKSYLDRVRAKYRKAGRPASTKIELRARALEDGHLAD